jgi:hypothetical protein
MPASGRLDCGVDFSLLSQPHQIAAVGSFLNLLKITDRLRLVAWLAGVIDRHDQLDLDRDNVFVALN